MLTAGNARFMAGEREHPNQDVGIRHRIANKQQPFAIFFGCADSRVAAEIIFDQGLGDLFVVRTAGHVVDSSVLGSMEFGVGVLGIPLIVVLGHDSCGAVNAAVDAVTSGDMPGGFIRDIAHAKIKERLDAGEGMPQYLKDHPVYYAGPAKTPAGMASGSFGPTTAGRMDSYVDQFQAAGGSMVMLAKGNRSQQVTDACAKHGGFYLGSIGGPAARLAQDCIKSVEVLEYPELGMEAVWKIEVEDFPAFIVVDDKGNDFFASVTKPIAHTIGTRPGL